MNVMHAENEHQTRGGLGVQKSTTIISGFPGVGKTFYAERSNEEGFLVADSDSSQFSKRPDFPACYIAHIKENIGKKDVILVSSHKVVREALAKANLPYILVFPNRALKGEYLKRYAERGSSDAFLSLLDEKWDEFLDEIENETFPTKVELGPGKYLSDVF
jgi:hypothetical protein